jgi:hypothetical protein
MLATMASNKQETYLKPVVLCQTSLHTFPWTCAALLRDTVGKTFHSSLPCHVKGRNEQQRYLITKNSSVIGR